MSVMDEIIAQGGHWVWDRDDGFKEFIAEYSSLAAFGDFVAGRPQRWYKKQDDGQYSQKIVNTMTGSAGEVTKITIPSNTTLPEAGSKPQPDPVDGKLYKAVIKVYIEDNKLVTKIERKADDGTEKSSTLSLEVKDGELYQHIQDDTKGAKCARIFKRYPHYVIENKTGEKLSLTTYGPSDFLYAVASMKVDIPEGTNYIDASGPDVEEEQAVFKLPDGKRWQSFNLKKFDSYEATAEKFE